MTGKPFTSGNIIHNVSDRRHNFIGPWEFAPLVFEELTEKDIGRTVIYRDYGRAEAGTITSFRSSPRPVVFARFHKGDTAAGCDPNDLVFGVRGFGNG